MSVENHLLQITQDIRRLPQASDAAQALVDWITQHISPAYLMLPDGLMTAQNIERNPELVQWLSESHHWRDLSQADITSEAIFIPLRFGGRTQGLMALETTEAIAMQTIPITALLASRLDAEHTAKLTHRTRALAENINQAQDMHEVLKRCVEGILPIFDATATVIVKFEEGDAQGESVAIHPSHITLGRLLSLDDYTAFSQLFEDGGLFIISDLENANINQESHTAIRTIGIEQVIAAPMIATGKLIGALVIGLNDTEQVRRFTVREQDMLRMLAHGLASAYVNLHRTDELADKLDNTIYKQLVDKANIAIDIHDPDGSVIYSNDAWKRLFLHDSQEQQTFSRRLRKVDQDSVETRIHEQAEQGQGWTGMMNLLRSDDSEFDAKVTMVALHDTQQNVIGYSTITDDISDLKRVMDSLQQQTTRLAAAASVSQAIITTQDIDKLTESVLRLICTQFDYDFAQILTINDERDELMVTMACDYDGDIMTSMIGQRLSLKENNSSQWVITNGRPLLLQDAHQDDRHFRHPLLPIVGSELVLLLQAANEILGVLIVQSKKQNAFTYDDTDVMQSISDQLAIAIYNASLFTQLRERLADMNAMSEVSLLVQAAFDLDALMVRIYDAMRRVHPNGDFTLALYNPKHDIIDLTHYKSGIPERARQSMGHNLISEMLSQAAPIFWRNDEERHATATYFNLPKEELPQSFLGLPLIAKDEVLGALYTHANDTYVFDENDLQFMLTLVNSAAFAIENMRLLDDTKQRVREMEIIHTISHTLSETFGAMDMWDKLLEELGELFSQGFVTVALYDAIFDSLKTIETETTSALLTSPPEMLARAVVDNGFTLDFQDLMHADSRLEGMGIDPYQLNLGALRSWLGTPLRNRDNEIVGVIALQSDVPEAFSERDLSLLNMVSAQISLALDNARLLNAEQERREVANSLIDMGRLVTSSLNIDDVFARIFEQVKRLLRYQRAAILIPSHPDNKYLMTVHAVDGFDGRLAGTEVLIDTESPLAQVLETREPVTIAAVSDAYDWQKQPDMLRQGQVQSWMAVPLVVQSNIIGLLTIDNFDDVPYTHSDATPIFALARQAAIAVENARLHTQAEENLISLKNRAERLASMHHLATYVSSSLSQEQILSHATKLITELFKVPYASIIRIDPMDGNGYLVAEHPQNNIGQVAIVKGTPTFDKFQNIVRENQAIFTRQSDSGDEIIPLQDFDGGYVIAPLIAYERVLGCITLGIDNPQRTFDEENLETFMTIAAQIAVAVRNAELFQDALEASRLKSEFLATVSHELRTPLNAIIGYTELLLSGTYGELDSTQADRMEKVYRSGRQLLTLINDILDLSKIEAGKLDLQLTNLDVRLLIQDALSTVSPQAEHKQLELSVNVSDDLPPILADSNRMRQVMVNLLSNAVKFTKEGRVNIHAEVTQITLKEFPELPSHMVARNNQWIHISVSDTGIGISSSDQKYIFEVFTQADGSSIREYEGTGLGLAITQRLIQMHKGHIWVESEVDVGSTFHLLIPTLETAKRPKYIVDTDDERPIVMIVDEDELTLQLMSEYLDKEHYQIITVRESNEIMAITQEITPDVIITDLILPNVVGIDILQRLKLHKATADVPIIICTILEREKEVLANGAAAYIKKPVMRNQLKSILDSVLQTRQ